LGFSGKKPDPPPTKRGVTHPDRGEGATSLCCKKSIKASRGNRKRGESIPIEKRKKLNSAGGGPESKIRRQLVRRPASKKKKTTERAAKGIKPRGPEDRKSQKKRKKKRNVTPTVGSQKSKKKGKGRRINSK